MDTQLAKPHQSAATARRVTVAVALLLTLALWAAGASGAGAGLGSGRGCLLQVRAHYGFGAQAGGLTVMVDGDYESYRTSETDWTNIYFADVNPELEHPVQFLDNQTPGGAGGFGFHCVAPRSVTRITHYLQRPAPPIWQP